MREIAAGDEQRVVVHERQNRFGGRRKIRPGQLPDQ